MKYRIWDKVNEEYNDRLFVDCNGDICIFNEAINSGIDNDDYTVELSTGLKDKNGVEIYEGDLVEYDFMYNLGEFIKIIEEVVWFGYCWNLKGKAKTKTGANLVDKMNENGIKYEVVGNIHDGLPKE